MIRSAFVLAFLLSGCSAMGNPCPSGSEPNHSGDRCILLPTNSSDLADDDAETQDGDASGLTDTDLDGSLGPDGYAGSDAGPDASTDASAGASGDAGDAAEPEPPLCPEADVAAWRNFHLMSGVVDVINTCLAPCGEGSCNAEPCLREAAGLTSCFECPMQETACTLEFCRSACGLPGNDQECLACVCESGCVAQFDSCAQTSLDICSNVHGRDAADDEFDVVGPWLLRMKSGTGLLQTAKLTPTPPGDKNFSFTYHHSKNFTHAVSFSVGSRHFVLQYKSDSGNDPCVARISPFLSDGTLGRPVFGDIWSRGWDEIEVFSAGASTYLLRYKTGAIKPQDEAEGHLRIDEITLSADTQTIRLRPVLNEPPNHATGSWTALETFALNGTPYLLRYASTRGEVQALKLDTTGPTLTLVRVSDNFVWSRGWSVLETFTHAGLPHVLVHKSGSLQSDGEPQGSTQIFRIFPPSAGAVGLLPVVQNTWPEQFRRIAPFVHNGANYFLMQDALSGRVVLRTLSEDPLAWATDLTQDTWTSRWGTNPIWDMVAVVQGAQETLDP